jgi:thiamine-monophosphate kinase
MDNLNKELTLDELGEFGFIRRFASFFNHNLPTGMEGIGNDCAVIHYLDSHSLLVTTDLLKENG